MNKKQVNRMLREIPRIKSEAELSDEQEKKLVSYYKSQLAVAKSPLQLIFAILGTLLVGLGIIQIFAHNWEFFATLIGNSGRLVKVGLSIFPLSAVTIWGALVLYKKEPTIVQRETIGLSMLITFAAAVGLVSQTYHTGGSLIQFMTLLMIVALPIIYLFKSYSVAVLYILGVSWIPYLYMDWFWWNDNGGIVYVPFVLALLPFWLRNYLGNRGSLAFTGLNWLVSFSLLTSLFVVVAPLLEDELIPLFFLTVGAGLLLIDTLLFDNQQSGWRAPMRTVGTVTLLVFYIFLSYGGVFTEYLDQFNRGINEISFMARLLPMIIPVILAAVVIKKRRYDALFYLIPTAMTFLAVLIGGGGGFFTFGMNILLIALGIQSMVEGVKIQLLRRVNFGFVLVATVIILRFFDAELPFTLRGIVFILLGIAFIATNMFMTKKKAVVSHEN